MGIDEAAAADPLTAQAALERVNYATGVMLDAQDFLDEQSYHRGALARALAYLFGSGTVAGLRVRAPAADDQTQHLHVDPGLALDRHGRLIEVRTPYCIRVVNWLAQQPVDALTQALAAAGGFDNALIVDVFVRFQVCTRGKTPAFASGPFDASNALVAARLADAAKFELLLRAEDAPPLPENVWPDLAAIADPAARRGALADAVLGAWHGGSDARDARGELEPLREHVDGQDTTSVFLARLTIPVSAPSAEQARPQWLAGTAMLVDNDSRPFVYVPGRWLARAVS